LLKVVCTGPGVRVRYSTTTPTPLVALNNFICADVPLRNYTLVTLHCATYLSELVPPRALRSSNASLLVVPRIHTKLACRAFSAAAAFTLNRVSTC